MRKDNKKNQVVSTIGYVPPNSQEAEFSVLGGLFLDNSVWDEISLLLAEDDFYREESRVLYHAFKLMKDDAKTVDILTMIEFLKAHNQLDQGGGEAFIYEISNNTPSIQNIVAYAKLVKEKSIQRKLIATANDIREKAFHPEGYSTDELLQFAESQIFSLTDSGQGSDIEVSTEEALKRVVEKVQQLYKSDEKFVGISTGLTDLDFKLSGLRRKDLIVLAGRPSMGKTTLALNIVQHVLVKEKLPVLFASIEMDAEQLMEKMISSLKGINYRNIETGKLKENDWEGFGNAVSELHHAKLTTLDTSYLTPSLLRSYARRAKSKHKALGLIVVDYLQLMQIPGFRENRVLEISKISRGLKLLAKEMDVPVLAISQLNRGLENREDKRPMMSDLRDSGAIEQDADVVCFVYRDEVYHDSLDNKGKAELIVAKNRKGLTGKIDLYFKGEVSQFTDMYV